MKAFFATLLAAFVMNGTPALADPSAVSPLAGQWTVDVSRLSMPPEARPESVTITFGDAGSGKWTMQVDIVDADGAKRHAEGAVTLDGTPAPVQGDFEADVAAMTMPTPHVLVAMLAKGGIPSSTRVYAVAADDESMVETATYFGKDGRPVMRTSHFTRVR